MAAWQLQVRPCLVICLVTCLVLCSLVAPSQASCGPLTGADGSKYDLDPLTTASDYIGKEEATTYTYYYNFCQNIKTATSCTPTPAAQVSTTGTCTPIGLLPATSITESSKGNIKIVYTNNNDLCGNPKTIPRISTFYLSCSTVEYNLVKIEEPGTCQYVFNIQSKYACPVGSKPPPSGGNNEDKMSGGEIFLIIFFVSIAAYFLVGVVVKWRVYNATGVELIPNTELWLGLPGLIRDGFLFVKNKLTGAVGYSSL